MAARAMLQDAEIIPCASSAEGGAWDRRPCRELHALPPDRAGGRPSGLGGWGAGQDEPRVRGGALPGDAGGCVAATGVGGSRSDEDRVTTGAGESVGVRLSRGC